MTRAFCLAATLGVLFACVGTGCCIAQTLTGAVSSAAEGAMEGVLVSAQKDGSPITVTVVSDEHGHFHFPDGRLAPGHYALRIRAVGYELDRPQALDLGATPVEVAIRLRKTSDLAAQLTNTEWFMSMPGTAEQKRPLIECMSCHTFRAHRALGLQCRNIRSRPQAHGAIRQQYNCGARAAAHCRARG